MVEIAGIGRDGRPAAESAFGEARSPRWSPDGGSILFVRRGPDASVALFVAPASGGEPRRLVGRLLGIVDADWSPDGRSILFTGVLSNDRSPHLYLVSVAGGPPRRLDEDDAGMGSGAAWSPDGHRIAYATSDGKVRTLDVPGGTTRTVTELRGAEIAGVSWSPDGSRIAFVAGEPVPEN
jgi:Tol biopolymer transport system component